MAEIWAVPSAEAEVPPLPPRPTLFCLPWGPGLTWITFAHPVQTVVRSGTVGAASLASIRVGRGPEQSPPQPRATQGHTPKGWAPGAREDFRVPPRAPGFEAESIFFLLTVCLPLSMDFHARKLEWIAISFSGRFNPPTPKYIYLFLSANAVVAAFLNSPSQFIFLRFAFAA